jgi:hypothetical protein
MSSGGRSEHRCDCEPRPAAMSHIPNMAIACLPHTALYRMRIAISSATVASLVLIRVRRLRALTTALDRDNVTFGLQGGWIHPASSSLCPLRKTLQHQHPSANKSIEPKSELSSPQPNLISLQSYSRKASKCLGIGHNFAPISNTLLTAPRGYHSPPRPREGQGVLLLMKIISRRTVTQQRTG